MKLTNTQSYSIGGFLFGLLFPLFSWLLDGLVFHNFSFGWEMVVKIHQLTPLHYIIDSAPLVLSLAFGLTGINLDRKEKDKKLLSENITEYNRQNTLLVQLIQTGTFVAPILIGLLVLISFFVLQNFISKQKNDAIIVNISGRQRMLSQRIAKHSVYLTITQGEEQVQHINALDKSLKEFTEAHKNLTKQSNTLGFGEEYILSEEVKVLYDSLEPSYQGLVKNARELLEVNSLLYTTQRAEELTYYFQNISRHEKTFLPIMNNIVFIYSEEGVSKVLTLRLIQGVATFLVIVVVLLIAFFGMRPLVARIKIAFNSVEEANYNLAIRNEELEASEEEIRQSSEELMTTNEQLESIKNNLEAQNKKVQSLLDNISKKQSSLEEAQRLAKIVSYEMDIYSNKVEWSESFADVFNIESKYIPTRTDTFQQWMEEEELEKINERWAKAITEKTVFDELYTLQIPINNQTFHVRGRGYPVFDSEGNLISMKGTLQDVTLAELGKAEIEKQAHLINEQNNNFISSVNYAQRIQSALLGGTQDIKTIFKDAFILFEPKDIVSGDFYWYAELDKQRKVAIVADCTGHGVPGSFMSLLGITILNEIILQRKIITPSEILNQLHKQITRTLKQETTQNRDGMDIAVVVVDESVGVLEFAGAKNPLVCINKRRKKGGAEANLTVIKGDNLMIGGRKKFLDAEYTNHVVDLNNIEAFYIYSDGFQDQFGGEEGRKFLSIKFRELLYSTHSTSMRHQRVALKRSLMNWMGIEHQQIDDICVMGVSV